MLAGSLTVVTNARGKQFKQEGLVWTQAQGYRHHGREVTVA